MAEAAPPPYAEEEVPDGERRQWKNKMCQRQVKRLLWFEVSFWLHALLLVGGVIGSYSLFSTSFLPPRILPTLILAFVPLLLSLPIFLNMITISLKFTNFIRSWNDVASSVRTASYALVSTLLLISLSNIITLEDLKNVPRNNTDLIYSDRSGECLGIVIYSLITIITSISLINVGSILRRNELTIKFLNIINWNGQHLHPSYNYNAVSEAIWKELKKRDDNDRSWFHEKSFSCAISLSIMIGISFIQFVMKCSKDECLDYISGDLIVIGLLWISALSFCVLSIMRKDVKTSAKSVALCLILYAVLSVYSYSPDIKMLAKLIYFVRNHVENRWDWPSFPLVLRPSDPHPRHPWKEMGDDIRCNGTAEAARVSANLLLGMINLTGMLMMARVFKKCCTHEKNHKLYESSADV